MPQITMCNRPKTLPLAILSTFIIGITFGIPCLNKARAAASPEDHIGVGSPHCPEIIAKQIKPGDQLPYGPGAVARAGDYILKNRKAGFVITGLAKPQTYYYYGGILVDAFPIVACQQSAPEYFDELQLLAVQLGQSFHDTAVRGFSAHRFEIINDGSDGQAAILRVHGSDEHYYIAEMEIVASAFRAGNPRRPSTAITDGIIIDYILEPDSTTLKAAMYTLANDTSGNVLNLNAALVAPGFGPDLNYFSLGDFTADGLSLETGVQWISAGESTSGYAISIGSELVGRGYFQGIEAVLNLEQFSQFDRGNPYANMLFEAFVSVGESETAAVANLQSTDPTPRPVSYESVTGQLQSANPLDPQSARIAFQGQRLISGTPKWATLATIIPDQSGYFSASLPVITASEVLGYRLVASDKNHQQNASQSWQPGQSQVQLNFAPAGQLHLAITDTNNQPIPAALTIYQNGQRLGREYMPPNGLSKNLAPGRYEIDISRGYEYGIHTETIDITAGTVASRTITLPHLVNTDGYLSFDGHLHQIPSPDSRVPMHDRALTIGAAGLDIAITTDHEFISDLAPFMTATGIANHVGTVIGEEVTAHLPNHLLMFPFILDASHDFRGDPVVWQGLDFGQIFANGRRRGAQVVALAHPRADCNYLCLIGWDSATGTHALKDPTLLFLKSHQNLWDWGFNAMEVMNGNEVPFRDPNNPDATGNFDDWVNFLNMGHIVRPMANTDTHGYDMPGSPRTYVASPKTGPQTTGDDLAARFLDGDLLLSTGAFAHVTIQGEPIGSLVTSSDGNLAITIDARSLPDIDINTLRIYDNCDLLREIPVPATSGISKFNDTIFVNVAATEDHNIIVAGFGSKQLPRSLNQFNPRGVPRFMTGASFIDRDGNGSYDPPGPRLCNYTY